MSLNVDPRHWHLRTEAGIPYKLLEGYPRGSFARDKGQVEEAYLIRASDLLAFVYESFPPLLLFGNFFRMQSNRRMPRVPSLVTRQVNFEPWPPDVPCDPWSNDSRAAAGTYTQFLKVTISYETADHDDEEEDEQQPETYLEISADTAGEFLVLPQRASSKWKPPEPGTPEYYAQGNPPSKGPENDDVNVPVTQLVPQTQWNVRWPRIARSFVRTLVKRGRSMIGNVNSKPMRILQDAPPETVLFLGFGFRQTYTWSAREADQQPVEFDFKFLEKQIRVGDAVFGHNHFYRPSKGTWEKLMRPNGQHVYTPSDLNDLFNRR